MSTGNLALAAFLRAPAAIRAEFWATLAKRTAWEHERSAFREAVGNEEAAVPIPLRRREPRRVRWDETWRRKARSREFAERDGLRRDGDFDLQRDRLLAIDPPEYVERLTGEAVGPSRKVPCPLPDHEERTASLHVYDTADRGWHCFGCHHGGGIYQMAGAVWGLQTRGQGFRRIHLGLLELWP